MVGIRKKTHIIIFSVVLTLIGLFVIMMMCMEIRLIPLSAFPSAVKENPEFIYNGEENNAYWWNSIHLDIPLWIPFTITSVEASFDDIVSDQTKIYVYDVEEKHVLPGAGRVTEEELFKMYPSLMSTENQRMHTKEAAIYVLYPMECVMDENECIVKMEYKWLGVWKKTASTTIY